MTNVKEVAEHEMEAIHCEYGIFLTFMWERLALISPSWQARVVAQLEFSVTGGRNFVSGWSRALGYGYATKSSGLHRSIEFDLAERLVAEFGEFSKPFYEEGGGDAIL